MQSRWDDPQRDIPKDMDTVGLFQAGAVGTEIYNDRKI